MGRKEMRVYFKIPKLLLHSSSQLTLVQMHEVGVPTIPMLQMGSLWPRLVKWLTQGDMLANCSDWALMPCPMVLSCIKLCLRNWGWVLFSLPINYQDVFSEASKLHQPFSGIKMPRPNSAVAAAAANSCFLSTMVGSMCQALKERPWGLLLQLAKMWHLALKQARVLISRNVIKLLSE